MDESVIVDSDSARDPCQHQNRIVITHAPEILPKIAEDRVVSTSMWVAI